MRVDSVAGLGAECGLSVGLDGLDYHNRVGADVIVKVVNPTEEAGKIRIKGDWDGVKSTEFEYYAPGSLTVANSMENKNAVALQKSQPSVEDNVVILDVPALSAGVLIITRNF